MEFLDIMEINLCFYYHLEKIIWYCEEATHGSNLKFIKEYMVFLDGSENALGGVELERWLRS